ncbi:PREDICTED: vasoactive intestinal polypeptide receptor 2, partial [Condylura cristata]|uniref:vasoactive intestinal polypeptide receptor 2 n=1 Tax=Condylura cristata TaxID=143302 RepID=UPI00064307EC
PEVGSLVIPVSFNRGQGSSVHPECRFHLEIQQEETKCAELLGAQAGEHRGKWVREDPTPVLTPRPVPAPQTFPARSGNRCRSWHRGQRVSGQPPRPGGQRPGGQRPSPRPPRRLPRGTRRPVATALTSTGNISKNCTSQGWSDTFPDFMDACGYQEPEDDGKVAFLELVKAVYTLGYGASLLSLAAGSAILCLFSDRGNHSAPRSCSLGSPPAACIPAWAPVAGRLLLAGSQRWACSGHGKQPGQRARAGPRVATGHLSAGVPAVCIGAWTAARLALEDTGCWDTSEHSVPWWVIRTPILVSILVNFALFVSILRILLQKLTTPEVGGSNQSQYRRLAKSTLLLIPLFGVHYMVFAVFPVGISAQYQIPFELCAGSFQGLVVAVLYCFLNSEACRPAT